MQDQANPLEGSLTGLSKRDWLLALAARSEDNGHVQPLGKAHLASYIAGGDTLLVSFESYDDIQRLSATSQPLGWEISQILGWSTLCILSDGQSWFRNREIFAYFDNLIDDGFFEGFERVVFYGAGPCGYAAAAYSIAAPGARVLAIQPQATLDARITEWDSRFLHQRRQDFTSRYGYASDMIDAAAEAFVLYDPEEVEDAMHAALFTRPNVTKLRLRHGGAMLHFSLRNMKILSRLIALAGTGRLTAAVFAKLARARRDDRAYLRNLLRHVDDKGRSRLAYRLCRNVTRRLDGVPAFERRLKGLQAQLDKEPQADA